jgi:hypothetical protein
MTRADVIRSEVQRLLRVAPFRPFALTLENGQRLIIGHPENLAFNPGDNGTGASEDFYAFSGPLRVYSTFSAVTNVDLVRTDEPLV